MGVTHATKTTDADRIACGGRFQVTLALTAEPDIQANPTDIVLILDRSRSMLGSMESLKKGADTFLDILDESTDGLLDGKIGGDSHIGIVSFATTATQDAPLTTDVAALKTTVANLTANGSTNHADAFTQALALFDPNSQNARVLVMFTDGVTTAGGPPTPIAEAAKAQGVTIYVIGLSGNGGIDEQALKDWASDPDSAYLAITPDEEELEQLFADLAQNIAKPGATNITILEKVNPCFRIIDFEKPQKGEATLLDEKTLRWKIEALGVKHSEGAELKFTVEHTGLCTGDLPVNEDVTYTDDQGNQVTFGDPIVHVECGGEFPEGCPRGVEFAFGGCQDALEFDAGDVNLASLGRILQLTFTVKNVCPGRRVALAIILTEVDDKDHEFPRGLKTLVIPAHHSPSCRDVKIRCVKFVLPEALDLNGSPDRLCDRRKFKVKFLANYIDGDFVCCGLSQG